MTEPGRTPYRKFAFVTAHPVTGSDGREGVELIGADAQRSFRLSAAEFAVARLFDGTRDAERVRAAALGTFGEHFTAAELEAFANELAVAGFLQPGEREPLPVPPQSETEAQSVGWQVTRPVDDEPSPSILPGSLSGPGRTGSVVGLWGLLRGQGEPMRVRLPLRPWLWLGYFGAAPAFAAAAGWALATLAAGGLYGLWLHAGRAEGDVLQLLHALPVLAVVVIGGAYLVNLFGQLARAAAIHRYTRTLPPFGLVLGLGFVPRFRTDTGGAPEAVARGARLAIVAAPLTAQCLAFFVATLVWLVFLRDPSWLPTVALGLALVAVVTAFLNLNPLIRRDGYFLLANAVKVPDLREQAILAVIGRQRPWRESKPAPAWTLRLYGLLVVAYIAWICVFLALYPGRWFAGHWGGTALVIFLLLIAYLIYTQVRRVTSPRSRVGEIHLSAPSQLHYAIACLVAVICLLPFPFQPSGEFVALPVMRADVAAEIDGPVTQVMVKEGDEVKAGQPLAKIGDDAQVSAVAAGKAAVARLEAQLALARGGHKPQEIELAEQQVQVARKRYEFSKIMAGRIAAAHVQHAVSDQAYDKAQQTAQVNHGEWLTAQRNLALVRSPAQTEQIKAIEAQIAQAKAQLKFNEKQLDLATIRAPIDGKVVSGTLQFAVGQYLHRGDVFAHVEQSRQLQVTIGLPQTQVGGIKDGAQAYAKVWAYPGETFPGKVTRIAPSVEKGPEGDGVVRVTMELDNQAGKLKPGMTGYAKIDAGTFPVIVVFTRALYRFFFVEVWSWLP
ncbi:MAG TPA: efflux RND transporter periplasmic adaptor subunit [Nevskiaceae bacterium]|nr:efflux RND transporter periplasmic adaptor subunit [Nevskiaceae bacterium]